jgi:hypothetical protein
MAINHWTKQQRSNNGEPQKQITVTKSRADWIRGMPATNHLKLFFLLFPIKT